jgi:hypothetical protein
MVRALRSVLVVVLVLEVVRPAVSKYSWTTFGIFRALRAQPAARIEDEDDDEYENDKGHPTTHAERQTPNAKRARLPRSIMQAHRSIHVGVSLCRIEEKLDATAWLLPLITDHGLHHVALWFFIPG